MTIGQVHDNDRLSSDCNSIPTCKIANIDIESEQRELQNVSELNNANAYSKSVTTQSDNNTDSVYFSGNKQTTWT